MIIMKTAAQNAPGEEAGQPLDHQGPARSDVQQSRSTTDFAVAGVNVAMTFPPRNDKLKNTLKARFALAGWALNEAPNEGFVAARWNRCVEFENLDSAAAFIDKVEDSHA